MLRRLLTNRRVLSAAALATTAGGVTSCLRIEEDVKLDYKDVLLRPKRSTLRSRAEVDLNRTFKFRHSQQTWRGTPIVVANMDTVGTFEMATVMASHNCMVAVHKHYTVEEWQRSQPLHTESEVVCLPRQTTLWKFAGARGGHGVAMRSACLGDSSGTLSAHS